MTGLTRKCQYALRALYVLAREYGSGPVMMPQISAEANAPHDFLKGILVELKNARILDSRRGTKGGYRLVAPPDRITIGSIIRLIDGPLVTLPCAEDDDSAPCRECREGESCRTRLMMREVRQAVTAIFDSATLDTECRRPGNAASGS